MIEIVKFDRPLIGYRQNNAVVYASVPSELNDAEAKQFGYEQIKSALEYEQTQIKPSIDGSDMVTIEEFFPESPKVVDLKITGDNFVFFGDDSSNKTITFTIVAYDQYGDIYNETTVRERINNDNYTHVVNVEIEGVVGSKDVQVYKYVEPTPQPPTLEEQLAEKDVQILKLKEEQFKTQQMTIQNTETQQELIELLMMMGVI